LPDKQLYEFGSFRIDVGRSRLERAGQPIPLSPKAFDLLVLLARNADRVLSKTELMEALWPNTFVEEANLTQHVYTLRKTLGDQPGGEPYIETVPRRGYRLAAVVRETSIDSPTASTNVAAVTTEGTPASTMFAPTSEGERKHATVLDCRLANAASIIERLDPNATHELVRSLMSIAAEETGQYEGVIHAQHPDGFVALFGAHAVHEDDGRRAVLAALGILRRAQALTTPGEHEPLDLRIGINTGPLVISRAERSGELSAVGEAARIATLLQQVADPGTILVGPTTRRAVEGYIDVSSEAIDVARTRAYRVRGPLATSAARPARFARTLAPFVGRQQELLLLDHLAAQVRERRGQAVSIVGEPGIGKSRLLHEFAQQVAEPARMTLLEARCVSYGSLVPYLPLADLIRTHCGVSESDGAEVIRLAVERSVREHDLPSDAGTWLLRLIGMVDTVTAAAALSPEAIKARTFDALRALFFKAAVRTPLIIVIEDAHWIDRTSEEFLSTLIERIVAAPIMLIASYRPGYRPPWLDRSYLTQITLRPLAATDGAQLVGAVARERPLPEQLSAAILEKAEGNPFFLEELARTVVERGPDAQGIPDTVHGVIMARVDRLPEAAKQVLQTASVIGREVPLPLLSAVWRGSDPSPELADLCRLEFLYERPGTDEQVLVFKHALTQDVAYDSLLARTRRELHLRAAEALVRLCGDTRDDLAATFAYHYARTDLIDEAVHWLTRAADRAARAYANAEAILHLDLAARRLQRLPETPDRDRRMLDVALRHAHSLYFLGRFPESVEVLLPHEARLARLNDHALTAAFAFWLAHMHSRLGDQRRAGDSAARAIEAATQARDQETLGKAHGVLALEGHWSGNTGDGIAHGEKAVGLLRGYPGQRWWLGMAHFYLAMNHMLKGDFEPALIEAARAEEVGKEIGDPRLQTYAGFTAAWVEVTRGDYDAAVALSRRGRELAPDRVSRAYASMILGFALLERGEPGPARAILEPVVAELESFGFPQWHGFAAVLAAETYRAEARLDTARSIAERGLEVTTRAQYWYGVGFAQRVIGRIARDRGNRPEAVAALDNSARTFERIGAAFEAARTREELTGLSKSTDSGSGIPD
jgi:DNA-binding winged helix-turn-helix (wHTH) protein/tetratricopeptide (TPR) repeat protein